MVRDPGSAALDTSLERDAAALYEILSDLIRIYQFRDRDRICCHDVSVTQCYALDALARHGPLTLNQLASNLYLDKSTASRVANALARKKLLRRRPHAEDGRAVSLELTASGRQLCDRIREEIQEREKRLLADFDPHVRSAMIELIARLARAAKERVSTVGGTCCSTD